MFTIFTRYAVCLLQFHFQMFKDVQMELNGNFLTNITIKVSEQSTVFNIEQSSNSMYLMAYLKE